jgi:hypothetical protein
MIALYFKNYTKPINTSGIALVKEVIFYEITRRNIPEDSHLRFPLNQCYVLLYVS